MYVYRQLVCLLQTYFCLYSFQCIHSYIQRNRTSIVAIVCLHPVPRTAPCTLLHTLFDLWETCRNYTLYCTNIVTAITGMMWNGVQEVERQHWQTPLSGSPSIRLSLSRPALYGLHKILQRPVSCLSIRILSMPAPHGGPDRRAHHTHLLNMLRSFPSLPFPLSASYPIYLPSCAVLLSPTFSGLYSALSGAACRPFFV